MWSARWVQDPVIGEAEGEVSGVATLFQNNEERCNAAELVADGSKKTARNSPTWSTATLTSESSESLAVGCGTNWTTKHECKNV